MANSNYTFPTFVLEKLAHSIQAKCRPTDGPGIRRYIRWGRNNGELTEEQAGAAHHLADRYVQAVDKELSEVPQLLKELAALPCVEVFALDDEMLNLANELALTDVAQKPFDHAILAGILAASSRLWNQGERKISFAERDSDLQPWGAQGGYKDDLRQLYDEAHLWVYQDFTLQFPARPVEFE